MAEQYQFRASATGRGHLIEVSGEIDVCAAPALAETLVQFDDGDIVVDLTEVTFIDASGLRALDAAQRHIERRNARLVVDGTSPTVRKVFDIVGIDANDCIRLRVT